MSSEVQPRRRKDKKKKKAQLEALVREEWEEGSAIYGAELERSEEEEVEAVEPKPIRDSSSGEGDEEEPLEDFKSFKSMTYKIIFFILLLILGGVAAMVLVENNNDGGVELKVAPEARPVTQDPVVPRFLEETNEQENESGEIHGIEVGDETSFLEKISNILNEFLEGERTEPEESQSENHGEPEREDEDESEEEIMDEKAVREEILELAKEVEPATQIPTTEPEFETQIENPLTQQIPVEQNLPQYESKSQWESMYPQQEPNRVDKTPSTDEIPNYYPSEDRQDPAPEADSDTLAIPQEEKYEDEFEFDFAQVNPKPAANILENEILDNEIL